MSRILSTGGGPDTLPDQAGTPPGPDTPLDQAGTPGTRHTPRTSPQDQTPPGPGRYTPRTRHPPPGPGRYPPWNSRPRNTVNVRPVRILLECILVYFNFESIKNYCKPIQFSKYFVKTTISIAEELQSMIFAKTDKKENKINKNAFQ